LTRDNLPSNEHSDELEDEIQWTTVATAPDQLTAEMWQQLLHQESIPSMLAPHDAISFMGLSAIPVRIMVPVESATLAHEVLATVLDDPASPETDQA
jgi:hypothetical protein